MNFYTRKVSSILTDIQEIHRMGLTTLKPIDVNHEYRKVEYQVRWLGMSRGFHPEILSKKGMTLRGTGSSCYTYSHNVREWKILPEDYETLEKFVIGFKVINSLSIIRYRQDKNKVLLDVSDETQCVRLDDIKPSDIQPTDDFLHHTGIYMDEPQQLHWCGIKKWGTPDVLTDGFLLKQTLKKETTEKYVETCLKEYEESVYG